MKATHRNAIVMLAGISLTAATCALAADWPQWRGTDRDGKVTGFTAPQTWPKELTAKWKVTVGLGDSTPALVGDKLYAFTREGNNELTTCLSAADGKQVWQDKYETISLSGPSANDHSGPRSSPAVADGKVVTFGVGAVLSCLDAESGKVVWRKQSAKDFSPAWPNFYTAMSPLIVDGMCIAHLGGAGKGAIIAYDLNDGSPKWRWDGEGPAYSSPILMTVDGTKAVVEACEKSLVAIAVADGKLLWQVPLGGGGGMARGGGRAGPPGGPGGPGGGGRGMGGRGRGMGGMSYNAATPIIDGQTIIYAGQGVKAMQIEKQDDAPAAKVLWNNSEISMAFNTPILKDGLLYGLSGSNSFFCLDAKTGKTLWTSSLTPAGGGGAGAGGGGQARGGGGRGMGGRRGGGMGRGGFGSILDAGSVLLAITPASELIVIKPDGKEFSAVARIKVADKPIYAYPIVSGNQLFIKDQDSLALYSLE